MAIAKNIAMGTIKGINSGSIPVVDKAVGEIDKNFKQLEAKAKKKKEVAKKVNSLESRQLSVANKINNLVVETGNLRSKLLTLELNINKKISEMTIAGTTFSNRVHTKIKKEELTKALDYKRHDDIVYYDTDGSSTQDIVKYKNLIHSIKTMLSDILSNVSVIEKESKNLESLQEKVDVELEKLKKDDV